MVPRQATLETILRQHELPGPLVQAAIESTRAVFNPASSSSRTAVPPRALVDGFLREFEYQIDADRFLRIVNRDRSTPEKLDAEVLLYEKETSVVAIRGRIDGDHSSLISAVDATGERVQLAIAIAELFSGQIDFENDLQPGDSFEVLFETTTYQGEFAGYGAILAARFTNEGKEHQAYRWVNPGTQKAGFYDEQGRSLRRFVLASPLRFTPRVTSGFSRRRLHPVHHTVQGSPRRRLRGADRHAGGGGGERHRRLGGMGGRRGTAGPDSSRERVRELLPPPVGVREGRQARARAWIRGSSSDASARPAPRRVRTSTTGFERTACSSIRAGSTRGSRRESRFPRYTSPTSALPATACCSSSRRRLRRSAPPAADGLKEKQ